MIGIYEYAYQRLLASSIDNYGFVTFKALKDFVELLRNNEFHTHIVIQGNNGVGKSYLMLELMKILNDGKLNINDIYFAYHTHADLIDAITQQKNKIIGIDEAKKFMDKQETLTANSIAVQQAIEYARENKNCMIACAFSVQDLNIRYREKQAQIIIWILERAYKPIGNFVGYGLVFVGNPFLQREDKFDLAVFSNTTNEKEIKYIAENISKTFIGYILIPKAELVLSKAEIAEYKRRKEEGINSIRSNARKRLTAKDLKIEIEKLE